MKNSKISIKEKIKSIEYAIESNEILLISKNENKVFLPYTIDELEEYAKRFPAEYPTLENVVKQEYMIPLDSLHKNPAQARFTETYYLIRRREGRNFLVALIYAIMFITRSQIDPAVIAACKTRRELVEYMKCLKENKLENFKHFKVIYDEEKSA